MSNTDQPQPPRTCGGCKWFKPITDELTIYDFGRCKAPLPMVSKLQRPACNDEDATSCPCFTAKADDKTLSD